MSLLGNSSAQNPSVSCLQSSVYVGACSSMNVGALSRVCEKVRAGKITGEVCPLP